jgi:hypothetical protein
LIKFEEIRTADPNYPLYDFIRSEKSGNIKSTNGIKDPKFYKANLNQMNIDKTSAAFEKGNPIYSIPFDIKGNARPTNSPPDLGAYQNKAFPK